MKVLLPLLLTAAIQGAALAQCPNDDGVDNHTTATAEQLPPGATSIFNRTIMGVWTGNAGPSVDWFRFDVGPGATASFDTAYDSSQTGLYIQQYDTNLNFIQGSDPNSGLAALNYTNTSNVQETFYLIVAAGSMASSCGDYQLESRIDACPGDDLLENNESCQQAFPLANVQTTQLQRLAALDGDHDWFETTLAPGAQLDVTIFFDHSRADLDLSLWDGICTGSSLVTSASTTNDEFVTYVNTTGASQSIAIWVRFYGSSAGNVCNDYELAWEVVDAPDDAFEDNDDIGSPSSIDVGVYPDLIVRDGDSDFYYFTTNEEEAILVADFVHADGDIDLALWELGSGTPTLVDTSAGVTDQEVLSNFTLGGMQFWVLEVLYYPSDGGSNTYELTIGKSEMGFGGDGFSICQAEDNSTGQASLLGADGTNVSLNSFGLDAYFLPQNAFGYFLCSLSYGFVANPGGSEGNLCIAGAPIGRFTGPGQIQNSGLFGEMSLNIDLNQMPQPLGFVSVQPGDTWFFQLWHRDVSSTGNTVSNFSNGIRVDFN